MMAMETSAWKASAFVNASHIHPRLIFVDNTKCLGRVELRFPIGLAITYTTNIRLEWMWLAVIDSLAYHILTVISPGKIYSAGSCGDDSKLFIIGF
jgi:hypothetical protein